MYFWEFSFINWEVRAICRCAWKQTNSCHFLIQYTPKPSGDGNIFHIWLFANYGPPNATRLDQKRSSVEIPIKYYYSQINCSPILFNLNLILKMCSTFYLQGQIFHCESIMWMSNDISCVVLCWCYFSRPAFCHGNLNHPQSLEY